jgi:gas vesicle protein
VLAPLAGAAIGAVVAWLSAILFRPARTARE